jgi:outer membrane protein OmpA-like peptidoglycan-associated protein
MRRSLTTWMLGGLLALTSTSWAQAVPPAGEATTQTTTTMSDDDHHRTIERSEVRTWTMDIDGREWEVHPAVPAYDGTTGLFHMPIAYTLPRGKFSFQLFRDNLDRDPKDEDISIHGVSLGFGVTDRFEIYGNFGLQNRIDADALFQPGRVNDYPFVATPWETGRGDLKVGAKFKFLDDYMYGDPLGLAIRGFVKIPTADEDLGLGTGKVSWGADLVLSKGVGDVLDLHGSIGFQVNGDPDDPVPVDLANAFKWAVGLNVPACSWIQLHAELMGTRYTGGSDSVLTGAPGVTGVGTQDSPSNRPVAGANPRTVAFGIGPQTDPLDLVIGPVIWIRGFFIRPAISWNLNFDDRGLNQSSKSWTGRHISIGYHPGWGCAEIAVPPPPPPPPPANRPPTVSCEIERSEILPGESVRVRATASDPDGDPLTYEWSATAGRVTGTGATATFDSTGMTPPASATVTVRVSDGRGGTASADCPVRMRAPERRPEAVICIAGGFPRNLARLTNVDKACLDDVASRLRTDPRARVIVVGHADSGERFPDVIARQRAEAVKDYLVRERGIEESRITTRSAGATRPLDTGTDAAARARNRRVEVIFVPEGATVPEDDD